MNETGIIPIERDPILREVRWAWEPTTGMTTMTALGHSGATHRVINVAASDSAMVLTMSGAGPTTVHTIANPNFGRQDDTMVPCVVASAKVRQVVAGWRSIELIMIDGTSRSVPVESWVRQLNIPLPENMGYQTVWFDDGEANVVPRFNELHDALGYWTQVDLARAAADRSEARIAGAEGYLDAMARLTMSVQATVSIHTPVGEEGKVLRCNNCQMVWPCTTLVCLGIAYQDYPGFNPRWAAV